MKPRCATRWWIGLPFWLLAGAGLSAEPLSWRGDVNAAAEEAQSSGRLLLVLHLSGDFTSDDRDQRPFIVYRTLALTDDRVREMLASRFVLAYRHVGPPSVFQLEAAPPRAKSKKSEQKLAARLGNEELAILYVCLPDRRVIHFVPGFLTARELLAELEFAANLYDDFARFPVEEQDEAVRRTHLERIPAKSRERFEALISQRLEDEPVIGDAERSLRAARDVRDQRLKERLGGNWSAAEFPAVAAALAAHGSNHGRENQFVLAAHGPLPLQSFERAAYTIWSGNRFWTRGGRRAEIADWIAQHGGKGRPLLLVVEADEPAKGSWPDPLAWPLKGGSVPALDEFDVLTLSLDELAVWMQEKELGLIKHPPGQHVRYVVFGREGGLVAAIHRRDRLSTLVSAMNAASRTGETAVSSERVDK